MTRSLQKRYSDKEIKELLQHASLRELGEIASAKKLEPQTKSLHLSSIAI